MTVNEFSVYVEGTPIQQGSMKAFPIRRSNGSIGVSMIHTHGDKLTAWREQIRIAFIEKYSEVSDAVPNGGYFSQHVPVELAVTFYLQKPKSNKLLMPSNKKADLDKLIRAVNDALSGTVFFDDCQVVSISANKRWADEKHPEGVEIHTQRV